MLSHSELKQLFRYDPDRGVFVRLVTRSSRGMAGQIAGTITRGYTIIKVDGRRYFAHRLVWLYAHGEWPDQIVDHIDGDPQNNRLSNLRLASPTQSVHNTRKPKTNTSGFKGVSWHKATERWRATLRTMNGRHRHLGYFDDPRDAARLYRAAVLEERGEFARFE